MKQKAFDRNSQSSSRLKPSIQSQSATNLIKENRQKIDAIKISNKRLGEEIVNFCTKPSLE